MKLTFFLGLLFVRDKALNNDKLYRSSRETSHYDKVFNKQTKFDLRCNIGVGICRWFQIKMKSLPMSFYQKDIISILRKTKSRKK